MSRVGGALLLLVLLGGGFLWASRQAPTTAINPAWAATYHNELQRILNIPPGVKLEFQRGRLTNDAAGAAAVFEVSAGADRMPLELSVSPDGRLLFYEGRTYRLADPFGPIRARIDLAGEPTWGPADAPLTIVEYSDYTCVYCKHFYLTLEKPLLERYGDRVRLVYKHLPLAGLRPGAEEASAAAACAYRQGNEEFWRYHDLLFVHADELGRGRAALLDLAGKAGVDAGQLRRCLDDKQGEADVARDVAEADELEIDGTPSFFFNGRPVYGLVRPEYFFYIVEQELAAAR